MDLYKEILKIHSFTDKNTIKIIDVFKKIKSNKIDLKQTKIFIEDDFLNIRLYSVSNKHCALSFMIGINSNSHKFFFDFIEDINILYFEDFSDEIGLDDIIHTIIPIFESSILKKDYYVDKKIYKTIIFCDKYKTKDTELIEFGKNYKKIWFFHKVIVKEIKFLPWISK